MIGHLAELWRYPVKSLGGERLERVACGERGIDMDREWSVRGRDGKLGSGKTTRRFRRMPGLLSMSSSVDDQGDLRIRFPDGSAHGLEDPATAARIGEIVGEPVTVAPEGEVPHHDDAPIHLLTTASLRWLQERVPDTQIDARRFRPNLVLDVAGDGLVEESWLGRSLDIGPARFRVTKPTIRCVMTTLAQDDLDFAPIVARELEAANNFCIGVYATVERPGPLGIGDGVLFSQ